MKLYTLRTKMEGPAYVLNAKIFQMKVDSEDRVHFIDIVTDKELWISDRLYRFDNTAYGAHMSTWAGVSIDVMNLAYMLPTRDRSNDPKPE